jgi:hypothetical protein
MAFDLRQARGVLKEQASRTSDSSIDKKWVQYIEEISQRCEDAGIRTHIAFLGTAILAKATDAAADVYSVKRSKVDGVYSARTLAHEVLVPLCPELGIHLGVTGREPLNNQPYFRMERFGDGTRIHARAKVVFARLSQVIKELSSLSQTDAQGALRSFIYVRRKYQPRYKALPGSYHLSPTELAHIAHVFVSEQSDGGRRAQALVAGMLDVFAGEDRVSAGRVNDPSRHFPGDVAVRLEDDSGWEKAFEVRDKPVKMSDALIFAQQCLSEGIREAAIVAIGSGQTALNEAELEAWGKAHGIGVRLFLSWSSLVKEVLFWSAYPGTEGTSTAIARVHEHLMNIEAPEETVSKWIGLAARFQVKAAT